MVQEKQSEKEEINELKSRIQELQNSLVLYGKLITDIGKELESLTKQTDLLYKGFMLLNDDIGLLDSYPKRQVVRYEV